MAEYNRDAVAERSPATKYGQREGEHRAGSTDLEARPTCLTAQDEAAEHLSQLVRTIETEIIPRLMLAHRADAELTALEDRADALETTIGPAPMRWLRTHAMLDGREGRSVLEWRSAARA